MTKQAYARKELIARVPAIEINDLCNEGYFGVYHAAVKWHPDKGITFLTQATRMVENYMDKYMDDARTNVRLPRHVRKRIRRANNTYWAVYRDKKRAPSDSEIAERYGVSATMLRRTYVAEALGEQMGSLESDYFADDRVKPSIGMKSNPSRWLPVDGTVEEVPSVEAGLVSEDLHGLVSVIVNGGRFPDLSDRERLILFRRFIDPAGPCEQEEVAEELGVTRQRISQMEINTLRKLREVLAARRFSDYIDN